MDQFRLDPQSAVNDTTNWRNTNPPGGLKAFTVRIKELQDLLAEAATLNIDMNKAAVRAYLAQKPDGSGGFTNTVIFALVDGFVPPGQLDYSPGTDIVEYATVKGNISGCFDFNYPCPNTCPTDSPLYNDENPITPFVPPGASQSAV
jgi:hypothetical protein